MKPKTLILIDTMYIGGAGKVILQFLQNADPARFDYLLCNFAYPRAKSREFIERAQARGFKLHLFSPRHTFDPSPVAEALRLVDRGNYNLIETHGYKAHTIGWTVRQRRPIKWITVSHGWTNEGWKMRIYNALDRWFISRSDLAIGVSPQLGATLRELRGPGRPSEVVLNAIDPADLRPVSPIDAGFAAPMAKAAINVGCFGRLSPEKGHVHLIRAWARVSETLGAHLTIVGDGGELDALRAETERLGVQDRITFAGFQSNMADWYHAIDLLVLPSLSEGLPFVVLEAMAVGKPVLSTDVGAIREVITDGENGWIIPSGDVAALSAQLANLLAQPLELKAAGARARDSIFPKFSPATHADRILGLYTRVLTEP